MSELNLTHISKSASTKPVADVLFIHGLGGDGKTTWETAEPDSFWPQWISDEFDNLAVYSLSYIAPKVFLPLSKNANMPFFDKAVEIADLLLSHKLGSRPLIIISYSLGGLVAKQILRACGDSTDSKWNAFLDNTLGVAFLATPHDGAGLASFAQCFPITDISEIVKAIVKDAANLRDLKAWYVKNAPTRNIKTKAYFETKPIPPVGLIVSENSANPDVPGCTAVPADADHMTICRPKSKKAPLYLGICSFLEECIQSAQAGPNPKISFLDTEIEKYKVQIDRLELDEKLSMGGRDYEIRDALRKKESFDKRYRRNSAQRSAETYYTTILAEVESRFHRHIYHLIEQKQSIDTVNQAIQLNVIDPLVDKYGNDGNGINASVIDEMIFYLTGLCNIRWHHEPN